MSKELKASLYTVLIMFMAVILGVLIYTWTLVLAIILMVLSGVMMTIGIYTIVYNKLKN
jgi:hypothetical protein